MEWTSTAVRIWFFPRNAIPTSIINGTPTVDEFGIPAANFQGSCVLDSHFYNMSLVFNIDFCGQYAGNVWQANGCPMLDPEDVHPPRPPTFADALMLIRPPGVGELQHVRGQ